ncbi:basic membrane lipoprotein (plasmid) [Rhizobium leguminosarum bv. trifolii WSM2304]|uniref:Basic membrane lipoprotein n=1 Tax=Rhizobium leguminosarum bv. trifolii (strain WSM2304) TaxID=395492 RepID=A0ABF7R001_RHILW|nr:BMP family ABC transporter substrate-binding protein [Rhizobium leguminosarum]ACI59627.1 basic membrane lipoprotein [Rhizobium leguminosarum bv. trifolii WSM2304]
MFTRIVSAAYLSACMLTPALAQGANLPIVFVSSNPIGINEFLKMGAEGSKKAAEKLGVPAKIFESSDPTTMRQNLEAAARAGATIIVVTGFEFDDILPEIAPKYPKQKFLQVDSCPSAPPSNVYCAAFREYETSFIAGAEAALTSEAGKVGVIGALDIPFIHRYTSAFVAGAKYVKPDIEVSAPVWIGGDNPFSDPARGQMRATVVFSDGADRVVTAAAASNGGVFKATQDFPGAAAFGVDVNECKTAPDAVMDNIEKRVDVAIEKRVDEIMKGTAEQRVELGLADDGMTLTSLKDGVAASGCLIAKYPDVIEKLRQIKADIISGKVVVQDPMAQN